MKRRKFFSASTSLAFSVLTACSAFAAPKRKPKPKRKGVQLVLLSKWSNASCDNFLEVATSPSAPLEIEIGFVPSFNSRDPYGKAKYVTDKLLEAKKKVVLVVHLAFIRSMEQIVN
jgi:ABC-type phosphate/phosphonate transport system substrate-binding protein